MAEHYKLTRRDRRAIIAALVEASDRAQSFDDRAEAILYEELAEKMRRVEAADEQLRLSAADDALEAAGWQRVSSYSAGSEMHYISEGRAATICGDYLGNVAWTRYCPLDVLDGALHDLHKKEPEEQKDEPTEGVSAC